MSPELGHTLFQDLRDGYREAYKGVLVSLAAKRRLRPVFVQRKPAPQQIDWLYKTCQLKPVDDLAENTLQVWLLKSQKEMLIRFLDQLGVEHDENGTVEDLPETLEDEKLKSAVDSLLKEFPGEHVALYLHVFQLQKANGWDNLRKLLESDPRVALRRNGSPAGEPPSESPADASQGEASVEDAAEASTAPAKPESPASAETAPKKKRASRKKASAAEEDA